VVKPTHPFELNPEPGFEGVLYLLDGAESGLAGRKVGDMSPVDGAWFVRPRFSCRWAITPWLAGGVHVSYVWVISGEKKEWEKM
jgi:hypothetical protein